MVAVVRKFGTLQRLVRTRGVRGLASEVVRRAEPRYRDLRFAPKLLAARLRHGRPGTVITFWGGIGDDMTCTVVCRELSRRGVRPIWMVSQHPDLFQHNDDVAGVVSFPWRARRAMRRKGWYVLTPRYFYNDREADRAVVFEPGRHMIATMCKLAGVVGPITCRPYITLRDDERAAGARVPRQVVVQSSGLEAGTPMLNKQWGAERFQAVVAALRGEYAFVQLGAPSDPPLAGVALDLRGRTSRRESAAILSRSLAFVGNVGFLMHLARAVECRSVVVYGGRERPDQSGYRCNENLYRAVPCAPCWQRNRCDYGRRCLDAVAVGDVVAAVRRAAAKHGAALEEDTDVIEASSGTGAALLLPTGP